MRYFKKAILSQNIFKDRNGKTIAWEVIPGNTGIIALDPATHDQLIEDLSKSVGRRGIVELTDAQYLDVKKNRKNFKPANKLSSLGGPIRVLRNDLAPRKQAVAASPAEDAAKQSLNEVNPDAQPNSALPKGDAALTEAVQPTPKPTRLGRPRKMRFADAPAAVPA